MRLLHYTIDDKKKFLKDNLSAKRFHHSVNVAEECRKLAQKYGEDPERAYFAGLLHDICKELPGEEQKDLVLKSGFSVFREELALGLVGIAHKLLHPAGLIKKHRRIGRDDEQDGDEQHAEDLEPDAAGEDESELFHGYLPLTKWYSYSRIFYRKTAGNTRGFSESGAISIRSGRGEGEAQDGRPPFS